MNSDNVKSTKIEHLPVDIFLEIYTLFSLEEILTSFSGLNSHIESTIRCIKSISHTIHCGDTKSVDLLKLFSTLIGRLFITCSATIDFTSLINLRSLTIKYGTLAQLNGIRPEHFPILEILHIRNVYGDTLLDERNSIDDLFQVILSNGFPRLRICTAVGIGCLAPSDKWTKSPGLRRLMLDPHPSYIYKQILRACPNLHPLRRLAHSQIDLATGLVTVSKRLIGEIQKLRELETKKKFILDFCSFSYQDSPLWDFNKEGFRLNPFNENSAVILGRILPEKEPYCFAAFLIEFKFTPGYPFNPPEVTILDPMYHPNFKRDRRKKCHCDYCGPYKCTTSVSDLIKEIIHTIDNPDLKNVCCEEDIAHEYQNNYDKFYETALQYTIKYGRPRQ